MVLMDSMINTSLVKELSSIVFLNIFGNCIVYNFWLGILLCIKNRIF